MRLPAFLPPRLWQVHGEDGSPQLEWHYQPDGLLRRLPAQWVIDRSFCIYRSLDLRHVPRNERHQALTLKLAVLSPFRQSDEYVVWKEGMAQIWIWDRQLYDQSAQTLADVPGNHHCIPETLIQPPPSFDDERTHVRLVCLRQGFDLQVWQRGVLLLSHFYPAVPTAAQYQHLLRNIPGLDVPDTLPVENIPLLAKPWARSSVASTSSEWERWMPYALSLALVMGGAFNIGKGIVWWWSGQDIRAQTQTLKEEIEPVLSARGKAISATRKAQALQRIYNEYPRQIPLFNEVAALLPNDSQLQIWRFRGDQLELRIKTSRNDPRYFVQEFQKTGRFRDVKVEPATNGGDLMLSMTVL